MRTLLRSWILAGLACVGGCSWLESVVEKLPPVQLCVSYKGKTFCASKVNGQWRFEAELTPEEQDEIVQHIEGR